jgi:hypothetical protein
MASFLLSVKITKSQKLLYMLSFYATHSHAYMPHAKNETLK